MTWLQFVLAVGLQGGAIFFAGLWGHALKLDRGVANLAFWLALVCAVASLITATAP